MSEASAAWKPWHSCAKCLLPGAKTPCDHSRRTKTTEWSEYCEDCGAVRLRLQ